MFKNVSEKEKFGLKHETKSDHQLPLRFADMLNKIDTKNARLILLITLTITYIQFRIFIEESNVQAKLNCFCGVVYICMCI